MTNDAPDPAIKPQIIDLDAEDVIVDDIDAPAAPVPPVPPSKSKLTGKWLALALLASAVAGGWIYKDILSSYLPSNEMVAAQSRIAALEAQTKTQNEQFVGISAAFDQLKGQVGSVETQIKTVADNSTNTENLGTALAARLASAEAATKTAETKIENLKSLISAGGTASSGGGNSSALVALAQRLDSVEKDVASLKTTTTPGDQSAATATLSQSLSDLKAKIASGASYRSELDRISHMVPAAAGLDVLSSHANEGLPTAAGLAAELTGLIPLLPKPAIETPSTEGSYMDGFWNMMKSLIVIRRIGESDWPSLAAQCAVLAESGDLSQAIEKIDHAEGSKPQALQQWRDRAAARIELEAALEETSKAVLRQITSLGAAP